METTTRMGSRSSSRHGPAVQFSGRVRKWQKIWTKSGTSEQLQMFRWLPVSGDREEEPEELPPRKYRFLPLDIAHAEKEPPPVIEVPEGAADVDADLDADVNADMDADVDVALLDGKTANAANEVDRAEGVVLEGAERGDEFGAGSNAGDEQPDVRKQDSAQVVGLRKPGADTGSLEGSAADQEGEVGVKDPAGGEQLAIEVDGTKDDVQIREALESLEDKNGLLEAEAAEDSAVEPPVRSTAGRTLPGTSTAGEIAESLVATGLVEEGEAAKVEARALANVVSEDANTEEGRRVENKSRGGETDAGSREGEPTATVEGVGEESDREKEPVDFEGEREEKEEAQGVERREDGGGDLSLEGDVTTGPKAGAPPPEDNTEFKDRVQPEDES